MSDETVIKMLPVMQKEYDKLFAEQKKIEDRLIIIAMKLDAIHRIIILYSPTPQG